ncbi:minor capsid protein [Latilactobacillus curvatus]|uniref:minor capsid protein n=1 Tax=Latilactobacillus curvatus TaxID=28038 RepID=UPI0021A57077|nr:minor capsid protein [Latilactobacillus curvatus]MCT3526488.1 capsid protein [Latilactobacillus curvatus]MDG2986000.1 minor capsid protein [Latilactobacillus curvatus]
MDFMERLKDNINSLPDLPMRLTLGYLTAKDSLVLYALPGGQVIREYYDGIKDQSLNYEIGIKTKDQQKANATLWQIQTHLEQVEELISNDSSFQFQKLSVSNKPFLSSQDEQGFFIYLLDITADLTTLKK